MIKITDVLGAMLEAQLKAAEWEAEFQAAFNGPLRLAAQVQAFLAMPPEERGQMSADTHAPLAEHARRMQQQMGGQREGRHTGLPQRSAPTESTPTESTPTESTPTEGG